MINAVQVFSNDRGAISMTLTPEENSRCEGRLRAIMDTINVRPFARTFRMAISGSGNNGHFFAMYASFLDTPPILVIGSLANVGPTIINQNFDFVVPADTQPTYHLEWGARIKTVDDPGVGPGDVTTAAHISIEFVLTVLP